MKLTPPSQTAVNQRPTLSQSVGRSDSVSTDEVISPSRPRLRPPLRTRWVVAFAAAVTLFFLQNLQVRLWRVDVPYWDEWALWETILRPWLRGASHFSAFWA